METIPVLQAPDLKAVDDVFDGTVYVPEEEEEVHVVLEVEAATPESNTVVEQLLEEVARLKAELASRVKPEPEPVVEPTPPPVLAEPTSSEISLDGNLGEEDYSIPDPNAPAIIEAHMTMKVNNETGKVEETSVVAPIIDQPEGEDTIRKELKRKLDEAGVLYSQRAHTATLQKLVDDYEAEE